MSCTCVENPKQKCIVHPTGSVMTVDEFKRALPDKMKKSVNHEVIAMVNKTLSDPDMYEQYRDNMISYSSVMNDGRFKLPNYVSAVKYCSHKLMGKSSIAAYSATFPEKIVRFKQQGVHDKDIASYVTAYNKSKLVTLIMEQSLTPFHVLNQDLRQKALNSQVELMLNAKSEKVRSDAANSVLSHTAPPPNQKIELQVSQKQDSVVDELRSVTMSLVAETRKAIEAGVLTPQEAAHQRITIEGEAEVVE
jgi:hypothetical protein